MQNQKWLKGLFRRYVRYPSGKFSIIPFGLAMYMAAAEVGRNGWAVMICLCERVFEDGSMAALSREAICERTKLTPQQVSRGLADLRGRLVIEPVKRLTLDGREIVDRSNLGHVAQYRFTDDCWSYIETEVVDHAPDDEVDG